MATKRVKAPASGRSFVAVALVGFLLLATGVIARRSYGIGEARAIEVLTDSLKALRGKRVQLESDIVEASSRRVLAPIVERNLGLHVPADSQVINLASPGATRAP
jgi:hypothetical protein